MQARATIGAAMQRMHQPQAVLQAHVFRTSRRQGPPLPGIEAAARHAQTTTEDAHRVAHLLRSDELKSHSLCLAKKAVAFFRISRSIFSSRFSFRSRRSS